MKVHHNNSTWIIKFHHVWFDDDDIQFTKSKHRGLTDCVIKDVEGSGFYMREQVLSRATVFCSKDEANFNKKVGRFLAIMKALEPFNTQTKQEVMKQYKKEHQLPSRKDFEQLRKSP